MGFSACAFPIIEFEQRSAPRRLAYSGIQPLQPAAATEHAAPAGPRQTARTRPSVIAPMVPEPEPRPVLLPGACHRALDAAGVRFEILARAEAPGVAWPIRLRGPVRGVMFEASDKDPTHAILDCRLALSLLTWAPDLRRAGVRRVEHYSMYRPGARVGGDGAVSGHAHGLAIDAARFTLENGAVLDVLDDWEGRKRGQSPCPIRRDESLGSRLLRKVTCAAIDDKVFQVVLTPHYNKAHNNHVHLERKPEVDWTYVR
jgi:hypothetical protein